jgi:hypothetical protein
MKTGNVTLADSAGLKVLIKSDTDGEVEVLMEGAVLGEVGTVTASEEREAGLSVTCCLAHLRCRVRRTHQFPIVTIQLRSEWTLN